MSKQQIKRTTIFRHNPTNIKINTYKLKAQLFPVAKFLDMEMNQQQSNLTNYDANPEI